MLFSHLNQAPLPLESFVHDNVVYTKEGAIREEYYPLCEELNINPEDLIPKTPEDFYAKDLLEEMRIIRFNAYEKKRQSNSLPFCAVFYLFY